MNCVGQQPSCKKYALKPLAEVSDSDPASKRYGVLQLIYIFARHVLNDNSHLTSSDNVKAVAASFVKSLDANQYIKNEYLYACTSWLSHTQLFPPKIPHFVSSYYKNYTLFLYSHTMPYKRWSPKLLLKSNQMDPEISQADELGKLGLDLRQSKNPSAMLGVFT